MRREPEHDSRSAAGTGRGGSAPIARSAVAIAVIALGAKLLGFLEKLLLAYHFGVTEIADAWFVAISVPLLLFFLIRELIEPAFLPLFVQSLKEDEEERGWQLLSAVGVGILVLTLGVATAVWYAAPDVAAHLAPGFTEDAQARTASLIRIVVPAVVALGLSVLTYITLNGYRRFAVPAAGDLALKGGPVLFGALLAPSMGLAAFAWGFVVGASSRLAIHLVGLGSKLRWLISSRLGTSHHLRSFLWLMLPLVVGSAFAQLSELADNYFSSLVGEGGVAARTYAKKLRDLPIEVVPYTLSIVLFPWFAHLANAPKADRLHSLLGTTVHGLAMVFAPVGVVMHLLSAALVSLALERGEFGVAERVLTSWPLQMYALGMVVFAVETVLVNFFFALKDTLTPIATGMLGVVLNIGLCSLLVEPMGAAGVALALTLSKLVKLLILTFLLKWRHGVGEHGAVLSASVRLVIATGVTVLGLRGFQGLLSLDLESSGVLAKAVHISLGSLVAMSTMLATLALIGRRERSLMSKAWHAAASSVSSRLPGRRAAE